LIWKSHSSFKHKVWGGLFLNQGLVVKSKLHKAGLTSVASVLYGKDEIVEHRFWICWAAKVF